MINKLMNWLKTQFMPKIDWIQVEVSSYCNARCIYCPHTIYKKNWNSNYLPLNTFEKLLPILKKTKLVYLQGWGEPLMNPNYFDFIKISKEKKCQVGFTTNGTLLNDENIRNIVELEVDIIALSLAGYKENNDNIRKGTKFEDVLSAIEKINKYKKENNKNKPLINIAYLALKSNLSDLDNIIDRIEGLGISDVVISTLDFIPNEQLLDEAMIFKTEKEFHEVLDSFRSIVDKGKDKGLNIHFQIMSPTVKYDNCTENIQKSFIVSSDGSIAPCVFNNVHIENDSYLNLIGLTHYQNHYFGNLNVTTISDIWFSRDYKEFRNSFSENKRSQKCDNCIKLKLYAE